jgi:hypothetical protein
MAKKRLPKPFDIDKSYFSGCFSKPGLRHFSMLIVGWALTVGRHTIGRVILTVGAHTSRHFASVYRFLSRSIWCCDSVSRVVFDLIVRTLLWGESELICVVDDTLNKRTGKKICGAAHQHDGSVPKGELPVGFGVCFVIIGLTVRLPGISRRVFCLPYAARLWWPEKAKVRPRNVPYKTKNQLALELIELTHSWLSEDQSLTVILDQGYTCETIFKGRSSAVRITGRARTDAALYKTQSDKRLGAMGRPPKKGERFPTPQQMFADPATPWQITRAGLYGQEVAVMVYSFKAKWYRSAGHEVLSVALSRDPRGKHPDCVFLDTRVETPPEETLRTYSRRWSIEITNREAKQMLGSADPQCRTQKAVVRASMIAYWAYSLVVLWLVAQYRQGRELCFTRPPWYEHKQDITFSDMLACARRSHFGLAFSCEAAKNERVPKIRHARLTRHYGHRKMAKL